MQNFRQLHVRERSHRLVLDIYSCTDGFPPHELYGICAQLRRAAVSVPANIAEGSRRRSRPDHARFLNIAEASLAEAEYLLILSRDLGYLAEAECAKPLQEADEILRMLNRLAAKVAPSSCSPLNSELSTHN